MGDPPAARKRRCPSRRKRASSRPIRGRFGDCSSCRLVTDEQAEAGDYCEQPQTAQQQQNGFVQPRRRYIHADLMQLAMLIRAAESREALSKRPGETSPALLAARDYEEFEEVHTDGEEPSDG